MPSSPERKTYGVIVGRKYICENEEPPPPGSSRASGLLLSGWTPPRLDRAARKPERDRRLQHTHRKMIAALYATATAALPLRVGVIGTGCIGIEHINNLHLVDNAQIGAIADSHQPSLQSQLIARPRVGRGELRSARKLPAVACVVQRRCRRRLHAQRPPHPCLARGLPPQALPCGEAAVHGDRGMRRGGGAGVGRSRVCVRRAQRRPCSGVGWSTDTSPRSRACCATRTRAPLATFGC